MTNSSTTTEPKTTSDNGFSSAIVRFKSSLTDLREFSELVESLIKKHKLKELETALSRYNGLGEALCQFDDKLKSDVHMIQETCTEGATQCESSIRFEVKNNGNGKALFAALGSREDLKEFDKTISTIMRSENGVQHMHRSSLISLVSVVESFLSRLLHLFFLKHPSAVNSKEKQFTFEELSAFSTMEDARTYLVSWKIENLLRGSYEDWVDYFKNQLKLELPGISRHHDNLVENFQRRNLFVHNDGVVNKIYLSKVSEALATPNMLDKPLGVTKPYLFSAIDRFESAFLQLAFELWAKCEKKSRQRALLIVQSSYDALQNKRWNVATEIAKFIENDKAADEISILMAKVNAWIARKRVGGLEAIKAEVSVFDVSAKDDLFRLARHCLLDEHDEALVIAKKLHRGKRLSLIEFSDWPLFEDLRSTQNMTAWLTKLREKAAKTKSNPRTDGKSSAITASESETSSSSRSRTKRKTLPVVTTH